MNHTGKISLGLALTASSLLLVACGGGSTGTPASSTATTSGSASNGGTAATQPTLQQRSAAATATAADNPACTSISPFYWEIGDKNGAQASGSGGNGSTSAPTANTDMLIASASKWMFSTYVVEQRGGALSASDIKFLTFQSGYTNLHACSSSSTVASCLGEPGDLPGTNGEHFAATDGKFYYNGGHMQVLASTMAIGPDNNALLATDMQAVLGSEVGIKFTEPQLAGGILTTANTYAQFLRNLLGAKYSHMIGMLGSDAVCAHTNSSDCPSAMYSPVNQSTPGGSNDVSNESWHYSLGHWVEDDPTVGDGAFSSPGRFGFYPWVDKTKTYYGVLARYDPAHVNPNNPTQASYFTSVECGRQIRSAWVKGQAQ